MNTKYFIYIVIAVNILFISLVFTADNAELKGKLILAQIVCVATVLIVQFLYGRRSFDNCATCNHCRYQHDKSDMIKRGYGNLNEIVCDDYVKSNIKYNVSEANFTRKYSSGKDLIDNGL